MEATRPPKRKAPGGRKPKWAKCVKMELSNLKGRLRRMEVSTSGMANAFKSQMEKQQKAMTEDDVENAKLTVQKIQKQKETNRKLSEELDSLMLEVRFFEQQQRLEEWSQNWRQRHKEGRLRQSFSRRFR
eukprot:11881184-Alexandrium_andersonii.AAC.1